MSLKDNPWSCYPHQKCIVKDCVNHMDEGPFTGEICKPCYNILTTGKPNPTTSILKMIKNLCIEDIEREVNNDK